LYLQRCNGSLEDERSCGFNPLRPANGGGCDGGNYLNPPELPDGSSFFGQVVCGEAHGVKQVFVAGQVGVDAQKQLARIFHP
jgi:hypothetical protein